MHVRTWAPALSLCIILGCGSALGQGTDSNETKKVKGSGCVRKGVEAGCLVLRDFNGEQRFSLHFTGDRPEIGTAISFTGEKQDLDTCQQGTPVKVQTWVRLKRLCSNEDVKAAQAPGVPRPPGPKPPQNGSKPNPPKPPPRPRPPGGNHKPPPPKPKAASEDAEIKSAASASVTSSSNECVKECQQRYRDKISICDKEFRSPGSPYYQDSKWHKQCLDNAKAEFDACRSTCN